MLHGNKIERTVPAESTAAPVIAPVYFACYVQRGHAMRVTVIGRGNVGSGLGRQRVPSSNLYAADDGARCYAETHSVEAGFAPAYVGPLLDSGAQLLKDSAGLTRAVAAQLCPFYHRYAQPGQL